MSINLRIKNNPRMEILYKFLTFIVLGVICFLRLMGMTRPNLHFNHFQKRKTPTNLKLKVLLMYLELKNRCLLPKITPLEK